MSNNTTKSNDINQLLTDLKGLFKERFGGRVIDAKLFGSYARGDARPDSDVDVLLVLDDVNETDRDTAADITNEIIDRHNRFTSIHTYARDEYDALNRPPTAFMQIMSRHAMPLW